MPSAQSSTFARHPQRQSGHYHRFGTEFGGLSAGWELRRKRVQWQAAAIKARSSHTSYAVIEHGALEAFKQCGMGKDRQTAATPSGRVDGTIVQQVRSADKPAIKLS